MKLIINIDALQAPLTGIGNYTRELTLCLLADNRVDSIVPLSSTGWHSSEHLSQLLHPEPNTKALNEMRSNEGRALTSGRSKSLSQSARRILPVLKQTAKRVPYMRKAKRLLQHVVASRNAAPSDANYWEPNYIPLPISQDMYPTIHDLSHRLYPQYHPRDRVQYLNKYLPLALTKAKQVLTVSEFSRQEIINEFGLPASSISVIHPGVNADFQHYSLSDQQTAKAQYHLDKPYILSVCTLEPRKNILRLVDAYLSLAQTYRKSFDLVLIGGEGWQLRTLQERLAALDKEQGVRLLGYVSQQDMPVLLSGATMLAYPSLYEGFGMPVLEAMASGTAVLTSKNSAMEEVCGSNALLVEPTSIEAIAEGIKNLLDKDSLRQQLEVSGMARADNFSWQKSANKMIDLFTA